jgi:hypothetical protein
MSDMPVLEPAVVTAIEDYFRSLQAHASAEQMLAEVLTSDFQTGFVGGHMWSEEQGLRDFLSARSVFFDESHQLLQIFEVALEADGRVRARTRLRFFLRRLEPALHGVRSTPAMPSIPGSSTEVTEGRRGVWRRSWLMASPTSTTRRNGFSRCLSKASTPKADGRVGHLRSHLRRLRAASATSLQRVLRNMLLGGGVYHTFSSFGRGEECRPHRITFLAAFDSHFHIDVKKLTPTHSSEY